MRLSGSPATLGCRVVAPPPPVPMQPTISPRWSEAFHSLSDCSHSFMGTALPLGLRSQLILPESFAGDRHTDLFTRYVYEVMVGFAYYLLETPQGPLARTQRGRGNDLVTSLAFFSAVQQVHIITLPYRFRSEHLPFLRYFTTNVPPHLPFPFNQSAVYPILDRSVKEISSSSEDPSVLVPLWWSVRLMVRSDWMGFSSTLQKPYGSSGCPDPERRRAFGNLDAALLACPRILFP